MSEHRIIYKNLEAEMKRSGITRNDIAEYLGISYSTIHSRFNGNTEWIYSECCKIRNYFFPDMELDYLFFTEDKAVIV